LADEKGDAVIINNRQRFIAYLGASRIERASAMFAAEDAKSFVEIVQHLLSRQDMHG
jgi:hypothetical protein